MQNNRVKCDRLKPKIKMVHKERGNESKMLWTWLTKTKIIIEMQERQYLKKKKVKQQIRFRRRNQLHKIDSYY